MHACGARDRLDGRLDVLPLAVDDDVRPFFVQRDALLVQLGDRLARAAGDHAPAPDVFQAVFERLHPELQIDDGAEFFEAAHRLLAVDDGAARRDDAVFRPKPRADGFLDRDEALRALFGEDVTQERAPFVLDEQVGVEKAVADRLGEQDARRALARAGHADEYDVVLHNGALLFFSPYHYTNFLRECQFLLRSRAHLW